MEERKKMKNVQEWKQWRAKTGTKTYCQTIEYREGRGLENGGLIGHSHQLK